MKKCVVIGWAVAFSVLASISCAGPFSFIKEKITGSDDAAQPQQQQVAPAQPGQPAAPGQAAPAQPANAKQPAAKDAKPQPTPDPEKIKEGARKLERQLKWEQVPGNLFQKYAGKWSGDLWVYSPSGNLEQHQAVQIECVPQADGSMVMNTFYFDRISKVWTTAETSTYKIAQADTVKVEIKRPTGEIAKQTGHFNDNSLFLTADIKDGAEHYRERIDGNRYLVDGFGVYGSIKDKDQHVFIGRLQRQR